MICILQNMDRIIYLPHLKDFESIAQQLHPPMWLSSRCKILEVLDVEAVKYQAYWENASFYEYRKWLGRFIEHL